LNCKCKNPKKEPIDCPEDCPFGHKRYCPMVEVLL
jgi:hypothetical protein